MPKYSKYSILLTIIAGISRIIAGISGITARNTGITVLMKIRKYAGMPEPESEKAGIVFYCLR